MWSNKGGVVDSAGDKSSDNFGKSYNNKSKTGIENGLFSFLEFIGITRGGDVTDATVDNEYHTNNTSHSNNPLDSASDHSGWTVDTLAPCAIGAEVCTKGNTDRIDNDMG